MKHLITALILLSSLALFTGCTKEYWIGENDTLAQAMNSYPGAAAMPKIEDYANRKYETGSKKWACVVNRDQYCNGLTPKEAKMKWGPPASRTVNSSGVSVLSWNLPSRTIAIGFIDGKSVSFTEGPSVY